jgi:hypothetical protein
MRSLMPLPSINSAASEITLIVAWVSPAAERIHTAPALRVGRDANAVPATAERSAGSELRIFGQPR